MGTSGEGGRALVEQLRGHVLAVMGQAEETQHEGTGLTNRELEVRTGLEVELDRHRGWLVWTILQSLVQDGRVEKLGQRYRLAGGSRETG